jgi:sugar phosphate permease
MLKRQASRCFGWRASLAFALLDWIATGPPTVALTAKIFGRQNVGLMFGWVIAAHQVGAAAIAYLAGFIRSMDGSYDHAFIISGAACIITAVGVLLIGRGVGENTVQPLAEAPQ